LKCNNISEIEGLENLRNLEVVDLSSNLIRDIKGLESLQSLKCLDLSANFIRDFEWTPELIRLEELQLYHNYLDPELEKNRFEIMKNYNFKRFSCSGFKTKGNQKKDFLDAYNERIHGLRKKLTPAEFWAKFDGF
jgi:hypothetical protein